MTCFSVSIVNFEQVNAGWESKKDSFLLNYVIKVMGLIFQRSYHRNIIVTFFLECFTQPLLHKFWELVEKHLPKIISFNCLWTHKVHEETRSWINIINAPSKMIVWHTKDFLKFNVKYNVKGISWWVSEI